MSESNCLPRISLCLIGVLGMAAQIHAESHGRLIDPTRPQGWRASEKASTQPEGQSLEALKLQGTYSLEGERSAIISGQRVTVGDRVSGAEVIAINKDRVMLRVAGETVGLASLIPEVKSPVNPEGDGK